jgi:hypothetical protein
MDTRTGAQRTVNGRPSGADRCSTEGTRVPKRVRAGARRRVRWVPDGGRVSGGGPMARDVIKDDFGGKLPSGRPFRPDIRPRPHLSHGRGFTRGRVLTIRRRGKNRVRADASPSPPLPSPPLPSPSLPFPPLPSLPPPSPSLPPLPPSLPPLYCPRRCEKIKLKKINFFLVVVAGLERENFFTIFGFRFSIPKIPELRGLCGRSHEKKKVFSA